MLAVRSGDQTLTRSCYQTPSNCRVANMSATMGSGIWGYGGASITDATNPSGSLVFAGVGNNLSNSETADFGDAIIALPAPPGSGTWSPLASWAPRISGFPDFDLGATPTLFTPPNTSNCMKNLAAVGHKNGQFFVFDQNNLGQGPLFTIPAYPDPRSLTNPVGDPGRGGFFGLVAYHPGLDALFVTYLDHRGRVDGSHDLRKQCIARLDHDLNDPNTPCAYNFVSTASNPMCFPYITHMRDGSPGKVMATECPLRPRF